MATRATTNQSRLSAITVLLPLLLLLLAIASGAVGAAAATTNTTAAAIARRSFFVPLAPTASVLPLLSRPAESAPQGLTFTLLLPPPQQQQNTTTTPLKPLIFLLNGANVEARWYGRLAARLAAEGYPVALSDSYRRVPDALRGQQQEPRDNTSSNRSSAAVCPGPNFALATSAGALQSLLRAADDPASAAGAGPSSSTKALLRDDLRLRERGVVLLGHSFGGAVGALLLGGRCAPKKRTTTPTPPTPNTTTTTTTTTRNTTSLPPSIDEFAFLCGGWQPSPRDLALLKGAVLLEGYPSSPAPASPAGFSAAGVDLAARREAGLRAVESGGGKGKDASNPFVLFLQGEFNGRVRAAYDASVGLVAKGGGAAGAGGNGSTGTNTSPGSSPSPSPSSSSTCVAYARFRGLNHYLGTDWVEPAQVGGGGAAQNATPTATAAATNPNPNASRQITPCGAPASNDPPSFVVTKEVQERGTARIAALIDAVVRAQVFADPAAERALGGWAGRGGAAAQQPAANATTTLADVAPGDTAELLHAGDGCRFGGGSGMTTLTTPPPPPKRR